MLFRSLNVTIFFWKYGISKRRFLDTLTMERSRYGTASLFYAHNCMLTWPGYTYVRWSAVALFPPVERRRRTIGSVSPHFRLELGDKCRFLRIGPTRAATFQRALSDGCGERAAPRIRYCRVIRRIRRFLLEWRLRETIKGDIPRRQESAELLPGRKPASRAWRFGEEISGSLPTRLLVIGVASVSCRGRRLNSRECRFNRAQSAGYNANYASGWNLSIYTYNTYVGKTQAAPLENLRNVLRNTRLRRDEEIFNYCFDLYLLCSV